MSPRVWLSVAALTIFVAVAADAFGAHGLRGKLEGRLMEVYQTAVRHHMYQALGLGLVAIVGLIRPQTSISGPASTLLLGVCIFSGSLYVLALTGVKWLGAVTPIGGIALLIGWLWFAWTALQLR